jgi:hypothetical protein
LAIAVLSSTAPSFAQAEQENDASGEVDVDVRAKIAPPRIARGLAALDRPTGMAEFGFGWLTLPGASVCVERLQSGCEQGDTSVELDAWQLYRFNTRIAVGAGLTLGLLTTTTAPRTDPLYVDRDHSRGYFMVEGIGRYYPYVGESFEAWGGITSGLVVVSDRFEAKAGFGEKPLIGPRGVTIRTEGYAIGIAIGGALAFLPRWTLGATIRYGFWFLPEKPETDVFGDEASLTGRNTMLTIGLGIAYRIPL